MANPPITDLVQIRRLGERKRKENFRFRAFLKSRDHSDRRLRRIAQEIQDQIDCRSCANCCRVARTQVTGKDIERLAKHLGMAVAEFRDRYTEIDAEGDVLLKQGPGGCVFLSGNDCTVHEARPHSCEGYPHLVKGNGSIASRMWSIVERAPFCPIVYNCLEAFKNDAGFRR